MDWPTTTLILGMLVPITVALIKMVPSRSGHPYVNGDRHRLHIDVEVLKARYDAFTIEVERLRKEMEQLSDKLDSVRLAVGEFAKKDDD